MLRDARLGVLSLVVAALLSAAPAAANMPAGNPCDWRPEGSPCMAGRGEGVCRREPCGKGQQCSFCDTRDGGAPPVPSAAPPAPAPSAAKDTPPPAKQRGCSVAAEGGGGGGAALGAMLIATALLRRGVRTRRSPRR